MKHVFIIILCAISIGSVAQKSDNPVPVVLDFNTKKFTSNNVESLYKLKKGQFYQVQITNINQNLFSVGVNHKDSMIVSNVTIPTFASLGIDGWTTLISGIKNVANATITQLTDSMEKANIIAKSIEYEKASHGIDIMNNNFFSNKIKKELNEQELLKAYLEKKLQEEKNSDKNVILEQINEASKGLSTRMTKAKDSIILRLDSTLLQMNLFKLKYLGDTSKVVWCLPDNQDICDYASKIEVYRQKIIKTKASISASKLSLDKFISSKTTGLQLMKSDSTLKVAYKTWTENLEAAIALLDKALEQINQEKMTAFFQNIINLENNISTTWTSLPIQYLGDIGEFEINITPRSSDFGLNTYKQTYTFQISRAYTGLSAGLYFASGFKNERYSVLETVIAGTSSFEIKKEAADDVEIGFTSLLHIGNKFEDNDLVGYHFSVGPAIALSSVIRPRLCLGGGLSFGKYTNMLTIDILLMTGYYDVKSNVYAEGQSYSAKPEQVTLSKLGAAAALSIGYIYKF